MAYEVQLYVYDMSEGIGDVLGIGELIHSSIVVHDHEIAFGNSYGVELSTNLGEPTEKRVLGRTDVTLDQLEKMLNMWKESKFARETYNVKSHNCNNFADEVTQFLCGKHIPDDILHCAEDVEFNIIVQASVLACSFSSSSLGCFVLANTAGLASSGVLGLIWLLIKNRFKTKTRNANIKMD